jgi:hypothetical protein
MFFVWPGCSRVVHLTGTGESGARARLAIRTAVRCDIPCRNPPKLTTRSKIVRLAASQFDCHRQVAAQSIGETSQRTGN